MSNETSGGEFVEETTDHSPSPSDTDGEIAEQREATEPGTQGTRDEAADDQEEVAATPPKAAAKPEATADDDSKDADKDTSAADAAAREQAAQDKQDKDAAAERAQAEQAKQDTADADRTQAARDQAAEEAEAEQDQTDREAAARAAVAAAHRDDAGEAEDNHPAEEERGDQGGRDRTDRAGEGDKGEKLAAEVGEAAEPGEDEADAEPAEAEPEQDQADDGPQGPEADDAEPAEEELGPAETAGAAADEGTDDASGDGAAGGAAASGSGTGSTETAAGESTSGKHSGEEWRQDILDKSGGDLQGKNRARPIEDIKLPDDGAGATAEPTGEAETEPAADEAADGGEEAAASESQPMGLTEAKQLVAGASREVAQFARWVAANQDALTRAADKALQDAGAKPGTKDAGVRQAIDTARQLLGYSRVTTMDVMAHVPALQAAAETANNVAPRAGEQRPTLSPRLSEAVGVCSKSPNLGYFPGAAGYTDSEVAEMSGKTPETKIKQRLAGSGYDTRNPDRPKKGDRR